MTNPLGFVLPAASIGLGAISFKPKRGFSYLGQVLVAQATLEELHHDELEITEHPVEQGAAIADHAFKRPAEIVIRCGWSNSPSRSGGLVGAAIGIGSALSPAIGIIAAAGPTLAAAQSLLSGNEPGQVRDIYEQLLQIQQSRIPFDVFTGKRSYTSMLFKSLSITTDPKSENALVVTAVCRQVIIVSTRVVTVPINPDPAAQAEPEKTQAVEDAGTQQLQPAPALAPDVTAMSTQASSALKDTQSAIAEITAQIPQLGGEVSSQLTTTLGGLNDAISGALDSAVKQAPGALDRLQGELSGALTELQGTLPGALQDAQSALPEALSGLKDAITGAIGKIPKAFEIPVLQ